MSVLVVAIGVLLVLSVTADMVNTLVTTTTSQSRWWLTFILYRRTWSSMRTVAMRLPEARREMLLGTFAPVSVLLLLLAWVIQQVVGFGLIWWDLGGIDGADGLFDSIYFSGVVYFTLGFGEVVPVEAMPRLGSLVEAFSGVLTTALVIGYLPALYSAYSERERKLMTLDDGTEGRITPVNLLLSRAPSGDVDDVLRLFEGWEAWVAGVIETHSTFPMLRLFRSKHAGQNWIPALGLLCDAAVLCQTINDAKDRAPYWLVRRSILLFGELTKGADLSEYRAELDLGYTSDAEGGQDQLFRQTYEQLREHGFDVTDYPTARAETLELRRLYDAQLEFLIDTMLAPRGFWGHVVGHRVGTMRSLSEPAE